LALRDAVDRKVERHLESRPEPVHDGPMVAVGQAERGWIFEVSLVLAHGDLNEPGHVRAGCGEEHDQDGDGRQHGR
jgi:hypothetical protein